jgi:hypothetical protein
MHVNAKGEDRQCQLEAAARAAFDRCTGRNLTDPEWAVVRGRLTEFPGILRAWGQATNRQRRGKVEELCQREP